ncbi:MAG: MFS transporter [Alphaproteobacteria bacterium]
MVDPLARRNVTVLALCQALAMSAMTITITVTALNGEALATDKSWATVPIGFQAVATMLTTMPASALMRVRGRRFGFALGAAIGMAGGAIGFVSILLVDFWLLCLANVLIGSAHGFAVFYRFAAADLADESFRSRAISLVVAGGVAAGVVGPTLARWTVDSIPGESFAGCYLGIIALYALIFPVLGFGRLARPGIAAVAAAAGRSLAAIVRRPAAIVALLAGMIGYGVMSFLMTATPLAMTHHDHAVTAWTIVIEAHVLAMFAPSFVTGNLIRRFGVLNTLLVGSLLLLGAVVVDLVGLGFWNFLAGLALLGVGWNFLFVGGTTLLTEAYRPEERAKVQGFNDFMIFGTVALASLSSGALHDRFGWLAVNLGVLPLIGLTLLATLWLMARRRG